MLAEILIIAVLLGLIPAAIAHGKGGNFFEWWFLGAALFIVALPGAIVMKDKRLRNCPFCAEKIRREASVCPNCQRDLAAHPAPPLVGHRSGRMTR